MELSDERLRELQEKWSIHPLQGSIVTELIAARARIATLERAIGNWSENADTMRSQLTAARAREARLEAIIGDLTYLPDPLGGDATCRECDAPLMDAHRPDCKIGQALAADPSPSMEAEHLTFEPHPSIRHVGIQRTSGPSPDLQIAPEPSPVLAVIEAAREVSECQDPSNPRLFDEPLPKFAKLRAALAALDGEG